MTLAMAALDVAPWLHTRSLVAACPSDSSSLALRRPPSPLIFHGRIFRLSLRVIPDTVANTNKRKSMSVRCNAGEVSVTEPSSIDGNWLPVIPVSALPKGERRLIRQDREIILLFWYKDAVVAIENRSPAEGAYTEGLLNAKLTQDGCIVCPTTDSTFDLKTGEIKAWYPNNPVLRLLTPPLRSLIVYPVKVESDYIYIAAPGSAASGQTAEIVFSGRTQAGVTSSDVNVEEVRMVVDENEMGFGFTTRNELINGRAAIIGFLLLLSFELLTGKGLLKGTGFLDFLYAVSQAFSY